MGFVSSYTKCFQIVIFPEGFSSNAVVYFCMRASARSRSEGVNRAKYSRKYISCSSKDVNIRIDLLITLLKISMHSYPIGNVLYNFAGGRTGCKEFAYSQCLQRFHVIIWYNTAAG